MDTVAEFRQQVERVLREHARIPYSHGDICIETIFDRDADHYLVMLVGWDKIRRVHGCLIHVDIIEGEIWIQRDGTEYGIARELMEAGIPKDRIVLGFRREEKKIADAVVA